MIYCTADPHGCSPELFRELLRRGGFTDDDFLFILGDAIDRGPHGAELLLWLTQQPNMQLILGNHEEMLLSCSFLLEEVNEESLAALDDERLGALGEWISNGGLPTINGLRKLLHREPELVKGVLDYLWDAPLYEEVEAGGRRYVLTHAGLDNFRPDKPLEDYTLEEVLWARPSLDTRYFDGATVVFGHTPTLLFGEQYRGRALRTDTWIDIDLGCSGSTPPMLLRLDDGKEFY